MSLCWCLNSQLTHYKRTCRLRFIIVMCCLRYRIPTKYAKGGNLITKK